MQSHKQQQPLKSRRMNSSSKEKFNQTFTSKSNWPRVTISRDKKPHGESNDSESLSPFNRCSSVIDANNPNVIACDIVELFCENSDASNEGRTTCPRISSSTEIEEDDIDVCSTCKNCAECQLQQQNSTAAKIRGTQKNLINDQDEELTEHLDYYEGDVSGETASTLSATVSIEHEQAPIIVDLTSEESKQVTWKQTILKRFGDTEENTEMSEPRIMIADSSSRLQRGGTGGSLATALRDRGPCVIPVQPNRSLPIRPAPPIPTRSAASIVTSQKTRSPILKVSKSMNLDVIDVQSDISPNGSLTNELNEFSFGQQDEDGDGMILTSELIDHTDYILPNMTNVMQITKDVNSVKRKNNEDRDKEYEKEITKDIKKRKKSHEADTNHIRDERVKNILKEYARTCSNLIDKGEKKSQQHVVVRLWDDKRYSSSIVVSTTQPEAQKTKEICNKVVPPLRLKKVVREVSANTTDEYHNVKVNAEPGNESNYRIVTGATPRPKSPFSYTATSFWTSQKEFDEPSARNAWDKSQRFSPKSDGYKIKYRRNRLRQKLRELRGKALELSREMTACNNAADTSPQRSTRLRQMMNCYEKQIENVSKLLCKLSASIPPMTDDVIVELDYENEPDERSSTEKTADTEVTQVNGISRNSISPSPSPEPPKLSPRSPIDYEKSKSPNEVRNTPPMLPRVYIAIQPTALECLKQNLAATKSWRAGDSSSIETEVKINDTDRTIIRGNITATPVIASVSSSDFKSPVNSIAEWDGEEPPSKMKNPEIEEKIIKDTKTFDDVEEHRRTTPPIASDGFLGTTMDIEIDRSDVRDTKRGHLDDVMTQVSETAANKQVTCEKQELEQRSSEILPSSPSVVDGARKAIRNTEYGSYDSEEKTVRINSENKAVVNTVTTAQEPSTIVGRNQVPAANVTNILQLQSNYYGSSVARDNVVFTGVIQNSRDTQKVTSSISQSVALNPTLPLGFTQSGPAVSSSNQQCVVLPNSSKVIQENTSQRNDGSRIMTEQFPTLGNWVARMSKKQATKSKSKLQSGVTLPVASTAETARVSGLEPQKIRASAPSNATRNNIVNVAPQWNTERWQRQQHQQRQQQLYAAVSSAAPSVRPGICPPISLSQFYPPNYTIDPYGAATFGYHSAICPYGDYSYHSRLHATAPPINGYQISPLQDSHASPLRQMQHLDKRFPTHLQDAASRHFATDLLKYSPPGTLSTSGYQHATAAAAAAAAATSLDYDRLRTATGAATQNSTASACLPPLLLPPPPSLAASAQQTLARTSLASYPANNNQCGRNRMIPDVVAAAAAAAVVAAASFGRQRGTLPPYGRTEAEMVSGSIGGVMDNESSQLIATNRTATNRERLPQEQLQSVGGVNVDSRLNNGGYRQLQNLILDRLPYVKTDDAYTQPSAIFGDNAQEPAVASSVPTSTYKPTTILNTGSALTKEHAKKDDRNCETPHLGKVNRTLETTSNLQCSNCGLTGSMFKCLGCEGAFYCDERCQTRHWSIHVEKCPKRMPKLKKLI